VLNARDETSVVAKAFRKQTHCGHLIDGALENAEIDGEYRVYTICSQDKPGRTKPAGAEVSESWQQKLMK
jgi:hypothetical protein